MAGEGLLWPYNYLGCAVSSQIPLQLHVVHYKLRHTSSSRQEKSVKRTLYIQHRHFGMFGHISFPEVV